MIVLELTENMFIDAFHKYGRGTKFSLEALEALYKYYSGYASTGRPFILDVVGICCEWVEEPLEDVISNYPDVRSLDYLQDNTQAIELSDGFVLYVAY